MGREGKSSFAATSSCDIIANADMAHDDTTTRRREGGRERGGRKKCGAPLNYFSPRGKNSPSSLSLSLSLSPSLLPLSSLSSKTIGHHDIMMYVGRRSVGDRRMGSAHASAMRKVAEVCDRFGDYVCVD